MSWKNAILNQAQILLSHFFAHNNWRLTSDADEYAVEVYNTLPDKKRTVIQISSGTHMSSHSVMSEETGWLSRHR